MVAIHSSDAFDFPGKYYFTNLILRLAVPYFFIASGYFLGVKLYISENKDQTVKNYIYHNFPYYIFYASICGLIVMAKNIFTGGGVTKSIINFFRYMIFYPRGAMWFVLACMVAAYTIVKLWNKKRVLIAIGVVGYVFALLCNSYYFIVSDTVFSLVVDAYMKIFISARNGLFVGVLFLGIGILLASPGNWINKASTGFLCFIESTSALILLFEVTTVKSREQLDDSSLYFVLPLLVAVLFELTLRLKMPYTKVTSKNLRRMSGYIYFIHPLLGFAINRGTLTVVGFQNYTALIYILKIIVCLICYVLFRNSTNVLIKKILPA